jgi:hypothetical protein
MMGAQYVTSAVTWEFIRERFGRDLREHYEVPRELPPNLLALVRKLDDNG